MSNDISNKISMNSFNVGTVITPLLNRRNSCFWHGTHYHVKTDIDGNYIEAGHDRYYNTHTTWTVVDQEPVPNKVTPNPAELQESLRKQQLDKETAAHIVTNRNKVGTTADDAVNTPKHYMIIGNTEACDLIRVMLEQYVFDFPEATPYQIYCAGNAFKYRLRAGNKDNVEQEIAKAQKYKEMHD